jgi:addiction module HigA family antidote
MKPRDLSQNALARALNVPPRRINEIVMEMRSITADTALRLARSEKERQIERDVEPLSQIQPAMA